MIAIGRQFEGSDLSPFFEDREDVCKFPRRREYTKMVRKLEKLVENRGELKDTGL